MCSKCGGVKFCNVTATMQQHWQRHNLEEVSGSAPATQMWPFSWFLWFRRMIGPHDTYEAGPIVNGVFRTKFRKHFDNHPYVELGHALLSVGF